MCQLANHIDLMYKKSAKFVLPDGNFNEETIGEAEGEC